MKRLFLYFLSALALFSAKADFFDMRKFTAEDGLTSSYIYTINQDRDEFLWLGTENGLFKFDGKFYEPFFVKDTLQDAYTASYFASNQVIYFGQSSGAITSWDGLDFNSYGASAETANRINAIVESSDQTLWFLTQNNGFKIKKPDSDEIVAVPVPGLKGIIANCMAIFNDILYVGTSEGLLRFDVRSGSPTPMESIDVLDFIAVLSIAERKSSNGFWVGTEDDGLYMVNVFGDRTNQRKDIAFKAKILPEKSIVSIDEAENHDLWLGTKYSGLYKINFNRDNTLPVQYSHFSVKTKFPSNQLSTLYVDNEETVWAGTMGNGVAQMLEKSLHYFPFTKPLNVGNIHAIIQNRNHEYFFGTDNGVIKAAYPDKSDSLNFYPIRQDIFGGKEILVITYQKDSSFVIGTKKNGIFLSDEKFENVRPLNLDINFSVSPIRDIEIDPEGMIWISISGHGLFKFDEDGNQRVNYSTATGFYHNEIYALQADRAGNIWTAAHSAGLAVIKRDGGIDLLTKDKIFPSRDINALTMDRSGNIWIATYGNGIFEYNGDSFIRFSEDEGLLSNYCNSIITDQDDHVWVGHRQGLSRLDEHTNSILKLTKVDGLGELNFMLGSAFGDIDHNIWMGNREGVTFLSDPHNKFKYQTLKTHITDVRLFYEEIDLMSFTSATSRSSTIPAGLKFEHDQHDITFDFIAVHLRDPDKNYYQYRLLGYEEDWSPPVTQNNMTFTNLDPGKYTFEVRQSDNKVNWSDENIEATTFTIKPPYWETWWFSTGEVTFLVLLVFATITFTKRLSNKGVIKFMIYVSLFIIFEYVHTQLEPYLEGFVGGAPIFQVMMHTLLALVLFPVETFTTRYMYTRSARAKAAKEAMDNQQ